MTAAYRESAGDTWSVDTGAPPAQRVLVRVAAVQFKGTKGDKAGSLQRLVALASRAVAPGADLVVLPEMAATGYVFDSPQAVDAVAEEADGPTYEALSGVARGAEAWLVAGFPERAADAYFNSAMVIDPSGALRFVYRKTLLYEADTAWAEAGDSGYARFDTDAGSFGVGICMDLNDERFVDWLAAQDVRALAFPTNWIDEGHRVWGYWAWRLRGTRAAMIAANTWGREAQTGFTGESAIIDGRVVLASAPKEGDAVLWAELASAQAPQEPIE